MRYLRNVAIVAFTIIGLLAASNAYAFWGGGYDGKRKGSPDDRRGKMEEKCQKIWDDLKLTPDQKAQLDANKTKSREAMKTAFEQMKAYRESLKAELMKPELDMAKINDIQSKIKALENQKSDARLNSILEVRKILNKEQFEKFIGSMEKHKVFGYKGGKGSCKSR